MIAAETKPSFTGSELVMYITTDRPWNERRLKTLFRRQDSRKRSLYAYYTMESAKSETMPDPLPEWDPSAMISLKDDFLDRVTTEFHKLYEEKSRKTSYAGSCLTQAVDSVRSTFRDDSTIEGVSIESRIEPNDNITNDQLRHGQVLYGADTNSWGLDFSKVAESRGSVARVD